MTAPAERDVVAWATEALDGIIPGPWWWGGNTDNEGDVTLRCTVPGVGWVDIMRTCREELDEEELGALFDKADRESGLGAFIDRDNYIEARRDHPRHWLSFVHPEHYFVQFGRDLAVYEVARRQGLPDDTPRDHPKVYRADVVAIRNRHAQFLADAPTLVAGLLAEVQRLRAGIQ